MGRALAAVAMLLVAPVAGALETWTVGDTALEAAFGAVLLVDWMQTRQIASTRGEPGAVEEMNPILGRRPTAARVNGYFVAAGAGHVAVAFLLPRPWRTVWQATWVTLEGLSIRNNAALGLSLSF